MQPWWRVVGWTMLAFGLVVSVTWLLVWLVSSFPIFQVLRPGE